MNAAAATVKDVRTALDAARARVESGGDKTLLFLDEIHRFNKAQQDVLLGDVEDGIVVLVGATTENPFIAVNSALVSRSQIFQFTPLDADDVKAVLRRALADADRGLGGRRLDVDEAALDHLANASEGDARRALSALEVAALTTKPSRDGVVRIDLAAAEQSVQVKALRYDRLGDEHYDHASALIKSMRASDPDAAIYWLARMLEAGEDPRFLARRLAIFASEDVGNAEPQALPIVAACFDLVTKLGLPECQLTLAQTTLYLATCPKSRASTNAIAAASADVRDNRTLPVPRKLKDAHYAGAKRLHHGEPAEGEAADYFGVDATYYKEGHADDEADSA